MTLLAPQDDPVTGVVQPGSLGGPDAANVPIDTPKVNVEKKIENLSQRLHKQLFMLFLTVI